MKRVMHFAVVTALAAQALVLGQGADVNRILADVREALGGEKKLAAVSTLTISGRSTRVSGESSMPATDFEVAIQLPDKYVRKDVVGVMGGTTMARTSGFNGAAVIEAMDAPPQMHGGAMVIRMGPGGGPGGGSQTPEQEAERRNTQLLASRQEFARMTLGMFGASFDAYPLTFSYAGQAESPEGKADVIEVKGDGDFAARLFVDLKTHLPLMLSWTAKEPLQMLARSGGGGSLDPEQLMREFDARMKAAEAQRRTVEYRLYYTDYTDVGGGVKMPARLQRSIGGRPADEQTFEKIKLNAKIDPKTFESGK